jgi:hypothetical protein
MDFVDGERSSLPPPLTLSSTCSMNNSTPERRSTGQPQQHEKQLQHVTKPAPQ